LLAFGVPGEERETGRRGEREKMKKKQKRKGKGE